MSQEVKATVGWKSWTVFFAVFAGIFVAGFVIGQRRAMQSIHREAAAAGAGEYWTNPKTGAMGFRWAAPATEPLLAYPGTHNATIRIERQAENTIPLDAAMMRLDGKIVPFGGPTEAQEKEPSQ